MKILVTGCNGFIGKNLIAELKNRQYGELFLCDVHTTSDELNRYAAECDFVFHLAGINRPLKSEEFMSGNFGFTTELLQLLKKHGNKAPVLMSSSIQATLANDYGVSKKAGEDYLIRYGSENAVDTFVFRLPNVFGKWCRPNYNSAVATFCHNIARGLPVRVDSGEKVLTLVYIDDVIDAFIDALGGRIVRDADGYCSVPVVHTATLGRIVDTLYFFERSRETLLCPSSEDAFEKKLYSTYLSYLPEDKFAYDLKTNADARGSFTEFVKSSDRGQVSVNVSRPHIVKGNHWHHTKNEKFLVVEGSGIIRFRKIGDDKVYEYKVSGEKLRVVDIPCGYTHNIENVGETDMVTVMWANELFDKNNPDTFFEEV